MSGLAPYCIRREFIPSSLRGLAPYYIRREVIPSSYRGLTSNYISYIRREDIPSSLRGLASNYIRREDIPSSLRGRHMAAYSWVLGQYSGRNCMPTTWRAMYKIPMRRRLTPCSIENTKRKKKYANPKITNINLLFLFLFIWTLLIDLLNKNKKGVPEYGLGKYAIRISRIFYKCSPDLMKIKKAFLNPNFDGEAGRFSWYAGVTNSRNLRKENWGPTK